MSIRCVGFDAKEGAWLLLKRESDIEPIKAGLGKRGLEHAMGAVNQDQAYALLEQLAPKLDAALLELQPKVEPAAAPPPTEPEPAPAKPRGKAK